MYNNWIVEEEKARDILVKKSCFACYDLLS